ncbi:thiamine pyrophosphate-binding protein [Pseudomonas matsuisoli]|uniref:Benzoylformate decarboxylase n=1 Tax=Pseudomonas matsuisoli TaxID=1515666 RepID=A0A917Q1L6_9PSED|nr:thiamine pyrophosphate-binding protein [Pseudomonas matsuisoli]GGK06499.1 benzoylformate decarboxylase [Pseudomonas matsuisoli]
MAAPSKPASSSTEKRRGADLFLDVLRSEQVHYIFGNPGTTELPLMNALTAAPDIEYVLGLQEASVVAMADGYAQASGKPGFVNLHTSGGLGNGIAAIVSAQIANTPLIITAGQQDSRHTVTDPLLYGDLVSMARPNVKWVEEIRHPEHIPMLLRRALQDCQTQPTGPVFLSLPIDTMERHTDVDVGTPSRIDRTPIASNLGELAEVLANIEPGRLAVVIGEEVGATNAGSESVALVELLGASVLGGSSLGRTAFPTAHPQWRGILPPKAAAIRDILEPFDAVLLLGGHSLVSYQYSDGLPIPAGRRVIQLTSNAHQLGRFYDGTFGWVGDVRLSLQTLLPILAEKCAPRADAIETLKVRAQQLRDALRSDVSARAADQFDAPETSPLVAAYETLRAVGGDIPIVDEAPATIIHVRDCLDSSSSRQYTFTRSGILGWAMPAAVGMSLGLERRPVVCLVGDGSAMYSPQALWTAAHMGLPVTFVVMNNGEYNILKNNIRAQSHYRSAKAEHFIGMDIVDPRIDFVALAKTYGVAARRVERAADIYGAVQDGIRSGRPNLIDLPITR